MAHLFSRRGALKLGAAAAGVAAVTIDSLAGCANPVVNNGEPVVVDEDSATSILDTFSELDLRVSEQQRYELPLGSVIHPAEGVWLPVMATGDSADNMNKVSVLSVTSGMLLDLVPSCLSQGPNWILYDARCSDAVLAWCELDMITRDWVLFASAMAEGALVGEPVKLWESDNLYDPPLMVCTADKVLWQVMPRASGEKRTEHSYCYLWKVGNSKADAVVESPGRFATAPSVSGGTVTLVPRVNPSEGVFYGITSYTLDNDLHTVVEQMVLPASIRPMCATRIGTKLVFAIEANYNSGGLLGQMGTYIATTSGEFTRLAREPFAVVCGTPEDIYVIKSRSSYFIVDVPHKTYSILTAADRCVDYGEYPAREGESLDLVTYSTIKSAENGYPEKVLVRNFSLIG